MKRKYETYKHLSCVSVAALPAGVRGSVTPGGAHLSVPSPQSGDPLRLLPARLHHPSVPESCDLWLQGRAVPALLDSLPDLCESQRRAGGAEREPQASGRHVMWSADEYVWVSGVVVGHKNTKDVTMKSSFHSFPQQHVRSEHTQSLPV